MLFSFLAELNAYTPTDHRGDPNYRRKTDIDGNLVRASIFNFGFTGREGGSQPTHIPYEWPKNTKRMYIALTGILWGAQVEVESGALNYIVLTPNYRTDPATGLSWNLEPVPEYTNPNSNLIAKSTEKTSWPTTWPDRLDDVNDPGWSGRWNGYFGKDQFSADQEIYYECTDNMYNRYLYFPDSTDLTRRGLALLAKVRVMAWSQILVNDVVFILHEITNDGTKDLNKTVFSLWLADLVGGDGDSEDDSPSFDLLNNVAWSMDGDNVGNDAFGSTPVGVAATAFLETPGNGVDGIDNDGDADFYTHVLADLDSFEVRTPLFTAEDFLPRTFNNGDRIVTIDENYTRHVSVFRGRDTMVVSMGDTFNIKAGTTLVENFAADNIDNLKDDDLDGIIDENEDLHLDRLTVDGVIPVRFINYEYFEHGDVVKRGLINAGDTLSYVYENMAPMIDETRDDGVDNDSDWDLIGDDVGLDGSTDSGDPGEGDGLPTSGAGTGLTGEPNIDLTDVSESDQIGLTAAAYMHSSEPVNNMSDNTMWREFLTPGTFFDPETELEGDYNLHVTSGYFPLSVGQIERISMAVNLGADQDDALRNKEVAQMTYDRDYQFAKAPLQPTLSASVDDGKVVLYWDNLAEYSFDSYMDDLGANGYDFQGYRIYKSTDPSFSDAYVITDADGIPTFYKPVAQFDLEDGISGLQELDINGIKFDLGDDTGLKHVYVDENVQNGQRYYYAVTSYDAGAPELGIAPSESPFTINVQSDGSVETGINAVEVIPTPKPAGYVEADVEVTHTEGASSSRVIVDIIDPMKVLDRNIYRVTFEDTLLLKKAGSLDQDTLTTRNFSLFNITEQDSVDTLIYRSKKFGTEDEMPTIDGFQMSFFLEPIIEMNQSKTFWNDSMIYAPVATQWRYSFVIGEKKPSDYMLEFGEVGFGRSSATSRFNDGVTLLEQDVNFKVKNVTEDKYIEFGFWDVDTSETAPGMYSASLDETDIIIFLEEKISEAGDTSRVPTWQLKLQHFIQDSLKRNPAAGDVLDLVFKKPFLNTDVYEFTMYGPMVEEENVKSDMDMIKVVPNPYIAASTWEVKNPYNTGRGPRELHFTHVPKSCQITIFNIAGQVVDQFEVHNPMDDGTAEWDMLTKDRLDIAYGLYLFHVEDLETGEVKTGKFAVIK